MDAASKGTRKDIPARYTIRRSGTIVGTYTGDTEAEVLNAMAQEEGHEDFEASCVAQGLVRDNYTVTKVLEE